MRIWGVFGHLEQVVHGRRFGVGEAQIIVGLRQIALHDKNS